jgi:hypothetical protein
MRASKCGASETRFATTRKAAFKYNRVLKGRHGQLEPIAANPTRSRLSKSPRSGKKQKPRLAFAGGAFA